MRYLSLFSGIETASLAWRPLGWEPVAFAEIDPFCSALLRERFPDVPNLGDVTRWKEWPDVGPVDVVCGGSPCQSFSVAGLRKGLDDQRGNLMLVFAAAVRRYRPGWVVWENVPGVLSSDGGRDFASLLGLLSGRRVSVPADGWRNAGIVEGYEGAYGLAWRVLDAQFTRVAGFPHAVPQRRRRVFLVGRAAGDERGAAAVLFERESLSRDPAPRRSAGERTAGTISARASAGGGLGTDFDCDGGLIAEISGAVSSKWAKQSGGPAGDEAYNLVAHSLKADGFDASEDGTGRGVPLVAFTAKDGGGDAVENIAPTLRSGEFDASHANGGVMPAIFTLASRGRDGGHQLEVRDDGTANAVLTPSGGRAGIGVGAVAFAEDQRAEIRTGEVALSLNSGGGKPGQGYPAVAAGFAVRRLTPVECERLQGIPDDWTAITYRGKPASDGPRYQAIGNAWAVNVARWVGTRIDLVESILAAREDAA